MRVPKGIAVDKIRIGGSNGLSLIAGPCVIESEESALRHAKRLREITADLGIPFIYKSSYDKANRTSIKAYRGPGLREGLRILKKIKSSLGMPVTSDIHCKDQIRDAAEVLDIIQIPAFLS